MLIKKFMLSVGAVSFLFVACQNNNQSPTAPAGEATPAAAPTPAPVATPAPYDMKQISEDTKLAKENLANFKGLLKQLDGLPATVRQAKADQIEMLKNDLSGMISKMQLVTEDLAKLEASAQKAAAKSALSDSEGGGEIAIKARDYSNDIKRYKEDVKNYTDAIKALGAGQ